MRRERSPLSLGTLFLLRHFSRRAFIVNANLALIQIRNSTMNSNNATAGEKRLDLELKSVEQIVLGTIFVCAVIANILVLMVMLTTRRRRRTTRMVFFICHLTIADLLVAFFSTLPMLIWKSKTTFFGGAFLCRLVPFLMVASTYISVYT